ncbi:MAG TPA: phage minor head protein [Hanamia sp.]|nr:phage minor head protein [Hanamia sp.]
MKRQDYYRQFEHFQQNREKHFTKKILNALKIQYSEFLQSFKIGGPDALQSITSAPIRNVLHELYLDSRHYGSLVYSQLPKAPKTQKRRAPMGFNEEFIRMMNDYFESEILTVCEGITKTTREIIQEVLTQATEEGRNLNWIENELTVESEDLTRNRARLIARTETVTASNRASYLAAAKTGLKMKKEWLSAGDKRVRPDHQMVNGSKIDMEDFFTVGDSKLLLPGSRVQENGLSSPASEVCNCRCVVLYIPVRINGVLVNFDYGLWPIAA